MRPWLRLHRRESGSFAQLPLVTRAIAAELLKLTDDEGRIGIGARGPAEAICFALGATRSDRRAVKKAVTELLEDGYLTLSEDALWVASFDRFQAPTEQRSGHDHAPKRSRRSNDRAPTEQRRSTDLVTTVPRRSNDNQDNPSESFTTQNDIREEKKREEKKRGDVVPARAAPTTHFSLLVRGYSDRYETKAKDAWMALDSNRREINAIAAWHQARRSTSNDVATWLDAWFADPWATEHRWPWKHAAKDPARFLAPKPKTAADQQALKDQIQEVEGLLRYEGREAKAAPLRAKLNELRAQQVAS